MELSKHVETIYETQKWFSDAMRDILLKPENLQKTHWRDCTESFLIERLTKRVNDYLKEPDPKEELRFLLSVANYSMMLADRIRQDALDAMEAEELGG